MTKRFTGAVSALLCGCLLTLGATSDALAAHGSTWLVGVLAGIKVTVMKDGKPVQVMQTDDKGKIVVKGLAAGEYQVVIDGPSLVAATERAAPTPPKKQSGGVSLGIGGMFGGGGHNDHEGHGSHGGGGGVGVGLSIPLGSGDQGSGPQDNPITAINISLPGEPPRLANDPLNPEDSFSMDIPYCPDAAKRGLKILVIIKQNGSLAMTIFDRWGEQ